MLTFQTSFHPASSLNLDIDKCSMIISHMPEDFFGKEIMVILSDMRGNEVKRDYLKAFSPELQQSALPAMSLQELASGDYNIDIYVLSNGTYWSIFSCHLPVLTKKGVRNKFREMPLSVYNGIRINSLPTDTEHLRNLTQPSMECQSRHSEIVDCARSLALDGCFPHAKALAVHDFVARNIAYDYDGLEANNYLRMDNNSALMTLRQRKGICQGYTNLTVALLRALGIPALQLTCYSLGSKAEGGWEKNQNRKAKKSNHVLTAAYYYNRWHLMDTTWDSDLKISDGQLQNGGGLGVTHKYFDVSTRMLSLTHKIIGQQ